MNTHNIGYGRELMDDELNHSVLFGALKNDHGTWDYKERFKDLNPSPHMPILGSSNPAANKDMMS